MMKKLLIAIVLVLLAVGGYFGVNAINNASSEKDAVEVMYTVERGPLKINLSETGTIKSRDQHIVKSQVEGRTSIIYVIEEGSVVKEGDLLVELDSSELQDRLVDQQIKVENTDADF
ncbi:MAG: biotin/lipoyl-binding protein, partial [Phycisphaerales bacterium]|nr:biotin/lipoyl-binding protein [Phycisphaerales bacterium]